VEREQLQIAGLTGVEINLDIAGPGSRSYAFIIDWHIRLLLALAWIAPAWMIAIRAAHTGFSNYVTLPALCIYFFYHPVLEVALRGSTPGKRMAGVRIVTRNGGTPSVGALIVRNIFRLIDSMPVLYLVGLVCCLLSAQRVRIGDMAAGTLLILDEPNSTRSLGKIGMLVAQSGLAPNLVELIDDVLERWPLLDTDKRAALARTLLSSIDSALTPESLSNIGDSELHRRLQAALAGHK
jgi:uncharacterized RDD family membrane protein YckC